MHTELTIGTTNHIVFLKLGKLFEIESARDNPYTRAQIGSQVGALPRMLEQAGMDSNFNQQMATTMFPWTQQAPVASAMSNMQPNYVVQPGSPSMLSQLLNLGGAGAGLMGATAMAGGPQGFNWWGS